MYRRKEFLFAIYDSLFLLLWGYRLLAETLLLNTEYIPGIQQA